MAAVLKRTICSPLLAKRHRERRASRSLAQATEHAIASHAPAWNDDSKTRLAMDFHHRVYSLKPSWYTRAEKREAGLVPIKIRSLDFQTPSMPSRSSDWPATPAISATPLRKAHGHSLPDRDGQGPVYRFLFSQSAADALIHLKSHDSKFSSPVCHYRRESWIRHCCTFWIRKFRLFIGSGPR
ncbi:hypothetical protein BD289DRAFT_247729 [Coniella lustricola]|uniref:Uncharacterized protein n=1 Tax=Coniella lustricola TaxID=2025994 RepID=A0A2T3A8U1_9PEZI|nr:hypothetical protein BD289DRAFT_247729 [Coniella lustricola]